MVTFPKRLSQQDYVSGFWDRSRIVPTNRFTKPINHTDRLNAFPFARVFELFGSGSHGDDPLCLSARDTRRLRLDRNLRSVSPLEVCYLRNVNETIQLHADGWYQKDENQLRGMVEKNKVGSEVGNAGACLCGNARFFLRISPNGGPF